MAIQQDSTDRHWPEVSGINNYAKLMVLMYLCVKGLGILVMTWTTVVLLGGFVSVLQQKDFWSLTAITLIQLAGTFDYFLVDKLAGTIPPFVLAFRNIRRIFSGSSAQILLLLLPRLFWVGILLAGSLIIALILVLFTLGLYISTGISFWRLKIHDYGKPEGGTNLKPALDVLYLLALVQGMLFLFMNSFALLFGKMHVEQVRKKYNLHQTNLLVSEYLEATVAGCKKARSSINGRNLVTYAVDLLVESKSPESYTKVIRDIREMLEASLGTSREVMSKQLLTDSTSFSHIVRILLRIMNPRSAHSRETREHAAGIVLFVADEIYLEQFPGGIPSISSLLNTSEECFWLTKRYDRHIALRLAEVADQGDWLLEIQERYNIHRNNELGQQEVLQPFNEFLSVYTKMFLVGLRILRRLAEDEDNCRVISNNEGLISMIMAPLISTRLHQFHHAEWIIIAAESLALLCRFMTTPGECGAKLRRQISSKGKIITRRLQSLIECNGCFSWNRELLCIAVEILLDLSVDTSSIMASEECSTRFIIVLLDIFLLMYIYSSDELECFENLCDNTHWMKKRNYIRHLAGEKLVWLSSQSERSAVAILQAGGVYTRNLTYILVGMGAKNSTYIMRAAEILENICSNYTNDDEYLKSLKQTLLDAVPKVLTEIIGHGLTGASVQAGTEENQPRYSAADSDIEEGPALPDNEQRNIHSSHHRQNVEEHGDNKLQEALLSLCETVCQKLISTDPDLACWFDEIASKICSQQGKPVMAFNLLVEEAGKILKRKND